MESSCHFHAAFNKLKQYWSQVMCVWNILMTGPFKYLNDRFPYPFMYLKREKGIPFGRSFPVKAIIGSVPPGELTHLPQTNSVSKLMLCQLQISSEFLLDTSVQYISEIDGLPQEALIFNFSPKSRSWRFVWLYVVVAVLLGRYTSSILLRTRVLYCFVLFTSLRLRLLTIAKLGNFPSFHCPPSLGPIWPPFLNPLSFSSSRI